MTTARRLARAAMTPAALAPDVPPELYDRMHPKWWTDPDAALRKRAAQLADAARGTTTVDAVTVLRRHAAARRRGAAIHAWCASRGLVDPFGVPQLPPRPVRPREDAEPQTRRDTP